ncbi:DUF4304 domain-containing protein [Arthrobacter sp. NicSoilB4]|uniref:DUF4304 domain-containing protein n=1 Tax=Arthrobacter sp. NicSoilB4 TaxID=2830997 RepID=UPI001CC41286|nr:DUF4304 domain-containing protein [Arthrobacter sp. NicSoilB4]
MTVQEALKVALKEMLGTCARSHGFKGTAPTWRKSTPSGDWAVMNVQSLSFSSAEHLKCVINLAVAPEPWLRWSRVKLGAGMPKSVTESLGLYRERLHPEGAAPGRDVWWEMRDAVSVTSAVAGMAIQLDVAGWPVLDRLLRPESMLEQVRTGNLGIWKRSSSGVLFARAEALLLMDGGPSPELNERLQFALENCMPQQRENALEFDAWVREQANHAD